MAKQPKKAVKPAPAKSKKIARKTATTKAPAPKATTKVSPKAATVAKAAKPAAKTKKPTATNAAPASKPKTKAKNSAGAKTTAPAKPKTASQAATPKAAKPMAALAAVGHPRPLAGDLATPRITSPATGAIVNAGANLGVVVSTNRSDLGYVVTLQDMTTTPKPSPSTFNAPAAAGSPFSVTIPGTNFAAGRTYSIRVALDATSGSTPPNSADSVTVQTPAAV